MGERSTPKEKTHHLSYTSSLLDSFTIYIINIVTQLVPFFSRLSPELGRLQKAKMGEKAASNNQEPNPTILLVGAVENTNY